MGGWECAGREESRSEIQGQSSVRAASSAPSAEPCYTREGACKPIRRIRAKAICSRGRSIVSTRGRGVNIGELSCGLMLRDLAHKSFKSPSQRLLVSPICLLTPVLSHRLFLLVALAVIRLGGIYLSWWFELKGNQRFLSILFQPREPPF